MLSVYKSSKLKQGRIFSEGGFTMVEMVMVVVIMAIMFTIGAASYREYQQRQYLENAVLMVEDDIKVARQLAFSGRIPVGCDQFDGYAIHVFDVTETYSIGAVCRNKRCQNNSGTDFCVKENVPLPPGIEVDSVPGFPGGLVTFLSSGRGVGEGMNTPERTADTAVLTFRMTGSGLADKTITIRPGGGVEVQ